MTCKSNNRNISNVMVVNETAVDYGDWEKQMAVVMCTFWVWKGILYIVGSGLAPQGEPGRANGQSTIQVGGPLLAVDVEGLHNPFLPVVALYLWHPLPVHCVLVVPYQGRIQGSC